MSYRTSTVIAGLALLASVTDLSSALMGAEETEDEIVLVGPLSREEIEVVLPDWVEEQVYAQPDREAAGDLAEALGGAEVQIFLGTWCSDSRRELGRLWRALDEAGLFAPGQISYVGVDRAMLEPADQIGDLEIQFVPTVFVRRDGAELGRIVESAPEGIEGDLLALLEGRKQGLLTGRSDLGDDGSAQNDPEDRR